jgi:hypothetical protein
LFAAAAAQFTAQPLFGLQQCGSMQPRGQGIVRSELPGLAGKGGKHVLGYFLGSALVSNLSLRRSINKIYVSPHQCCERVLISPTRKIPQQLEILKPLVHLNHKLPLTARNRNDFYNRSAKPGSRYRRHTQKKRLQSSASLINYDPL